MSLLSLLTLSFLSSESKYWFKKFSADRSYRSKVSSGRVCIWVRSEFWAGDDQLEGINLLLKTFLLSFCLSCFVSSSCSNDPLCSVLCTSFHLVSPFTIYKMRCRDSRTSNKLRARQQPFEVRMLEFDSCFLYPFPFLNFCTALWFLCYKYKIPWPIVPCRAVELIVLWDLILNVSVNALRIRVEFNDERCSARHEGMMFWYMYEITSMKWKTSRVSLHALLVQPTCINFTCTWCIVHRKHHALTLALQFQRPSGRG